MTQHSDSNGMLSFNDRAYPAIRLGGLLLAALLVIGLAWINGQAEAAGLIPEPWDKLAHALTFGMIALAVTAWVGGGRRWLAFGLVVIIAGCDETRQTILPGRTASLGDFVTDVAAALIVAFLTPRSATWVNGRLAALTWRLNRLRVMSATEVIYRSNRAMRVGFERLGLGRARPPVAQDRCGAAWTPVLPSAFEPVYYQRSADKILAGEFKIFNIRAAYLGFPPKWNAEPKSGIEAPLVFGKTLKYRDERVVGDIKYLWEPNRHLELVTLAQAWHLTRDMRYALGCRTLVSSWIEQCPYPLGPNWTSSLEHGIRLVNWAIAWHMLEGQSSPVFDGSEGLEFRRNWLNAIYCHCHFIAGHLSRHSSANNHLLGELVGLFVATLTWPSWAKSTSWRTLAQREFEREALKQNAADGVNREQAVWYHHEVADMMLLALLFGRANGVEFSAAFSQRLEAMLEFVRSVMHAGKVPMIGDADDAVIVRFSQEPDFDPFRSLLATGAVLFGRSDFKAAALRIDDKTRWLLGADAAVGYEALGVNHEPPKDAFPDSGYYIVGARFNRDDEIKIVADAGPLGYLSTAAHGHADALALTLAVAGRELLIDPGTYAYHTQKRWRDYFRGTSAHNTLRVDKLDQSVSGGNFLWLRKANARCILWDSRNERDRLVAEHDGYKRLSDPVTHRRELTLEKPERKLVVVDVVECLGEHDIEQFWHFSEDCRLERVGDEEFEVIAGRLSARIHIDRKLATELVCGDEKRPLGWISRRYDVREPTMTLVCGTRISGETRFITEIFLQ